MMDRRDFLKAAAFAGLAVSTPLGRLTSARAQVGTYQGPFWVMVNAGGGWDPTSFCDPKGRANEEDPDPMNMYFTGDIETAGNISYAPVGGNNAFFQKYYNQLTVINGIDTQTVSHDGGSRHTWSGKLSEGHPSFGALLAGTMGRELPMSYISNGGFDITAGLVAPTRVGNVNALNRIAYPNRISDSNPDDRFHSPSTESRILRAQKARLERLQSKQQLRSYQHAMGELTVARSTKNELSLLSEYLPDPLDNSGNGLFRQSQLAIAAYKAGLAVSVNMSTGGFDTHGNHDANHIPRLQTLFEGVDFLMEEAQRQGVADRIVVVIGSDFGRTPGYNDGQGKDHWSITSMMFMGQGIPGNKVIGSTDGRHNPHKINPQTLAQDDNGVRIEPKHIHQQLRKLAGVHDHDNALRHPIGDDEMPLFG
jgi:hypothetical protein